MTYSFPGRSAVPAADDRPAPWSLNMRPANRIVEIYDRISSSLVRQVPVSCVELQSRTSYRERVVGIQVVLLPDREVRVDNGFKVVPCRRLASKTLVGICQGRSARRHNVGPRM